MEYVKGSNYDVPESFKIGKLTPKTTVFEGADKGNAPRRNLVKL